MEYWIVVVDDEVISLTNARNMLGEENMRVSCLRSGPELLKFMEKNSPDLVLLDILMPDMDGFETFHALRRQEDELGRPHIPVIFLTGDNDSAVEQKGLEIGASDFIRKPFSKEIVVRRIENTITNKKTIETLTEEAMFDHLTGFLNKSRGTERIAKLCTRMRGALMILDIDNFKLVNDLFGHEMGDRMLKAVADIIRDNTRETDTVSRIGGDEFLAFCEDFTDEDAMAALALRLNTRIRETAAALMGEDHGIPLGISVGVAMIPEHGREYEALFSKADNALYQVKEHGKHGYRIFTKGRNHEDTEASEPDERLERILRIMDERNDKREAFLLENDAFALLYRFVMRNLEKYGGSASVLLFTLSTAEGEEPLLLSKAAAGFSSLLKRMLRISDVILQDGSDSFIALLTNRTRTETASDVEAILNAWKAENTDGTSIAYIIKNLGDASE